MILNVPNALTFLRIGIIPILGALFYVPKPWAATLSGILFAIACMTDFLDGYLARTLSQTTRWGQCLDPIADKLLIGSTLLFLAGLGRLSAWALIPAVVILCREILMSGLREALGDLSGSVVPVTRLSQYKTAFQMLALTLLVWNREGSLWGEILLTLSAVITVTTGITYLRSYNLYLKRMPKESDKHS